MVAVLVIGSIFLLGGIFAISISKDVGGEAMLGAMLFFLIGLVMVIFGATHIH